MNKFTITIEERGQGISVEFDGAGSPESMACITANILLRMSPNASAQAKQIIAERKAQEALERAVTSPTGKPTLH